MSTTALLFGVLVAFLEGRPALEGAPFVIDGVTVLVFAILILAAALALQGMARAGRGSDNGK